MAPSVIICDSRLYPRVNRAQSIECAALVRRLGENSRLSSPCCLLANGEGALFDSGTQTGVFSSAKTSTMDFSRESVRAENSFQNDDQCIECVNQ